MKMLGHWLLGIRGTERLEQVSQKLHFQILENTKLPLTAYRPWMDCERRRDYFIQNLPTRSFDHSKPQVITNNAELDFLRNAFDKSTSEPFGLLDQSKAPFKIATGAQAQALQFHSKISDALTLIRKSSPNLERRFNALVKEILPLAPVNENKPMREMGAGRSVHWYKGGIFVGLPKPFEFDRIELAINLVHEMGHQALMVYQNADRLLTGDLDGLVYSAIRKVPRPAVLSLHALVALAYMAEFLILIDRSQVSATEWEYVNARRQEIFVAQKLGLRSFEGVAFTEFGKMLFDELSEQLSLGIAA